MSADLVTSAAWQFLRDATPRPAGLRLDRILLEETLPQNAEPGDLPLVAVYLAEDTQKEAADGLSNRLAILQVEIRVLVPEGQTPLAATKPFRAWALRALLPDMELDSGLDGAEFLAFRPFSIPSQYRVAGALLELSVPYFFDPKES